MPELRLWVIKVIQGRPSSHLAHSDQGQKTAIPPTRSVEGRRYRCRYSLGKRSGGPEP